MIKHIFYIFFFLYSYNLFSQDSVSIYFDINKKEIGPSQKSIIDSLLKTDFITGDFSISILGYADYLGSINYNKQLSKDRANAVKKTITTEGFANKRIVKIIGMGEQAEVPNDTNQIGNKKDRRVDIIFQSNNVQSKKSSLQESVDKLKKGETMVFKNINFEGGRHFLLPESFDEVKKLLEILTENKKIKIEIQGHICCDDGNPDGLDFDTNEYKLSENRAKYIYEYLVKHGISSDRLQYIGFGRSNPIIQNELTEEDRKTNRRVEIKILDK